eukprot:TRINITY_DN542_c0_g1_i1.p1 TRINITY_DN542_c0_g1~~TRINITY_DN542_c0_g1_i1.p1  ORF type:complete len:112 (+),score=2.82 TRINITY_DN542_c0_g1_i1:1596-1931(+)
MINSTIILIKVQCIREINELLIQLLLSRIDCYNSDSNYKSVSNDYLVKPSLRILISLLCNCFSLFPTDLESDLGQFQQFYETFKTKRRFQDTTSPIRLSTSQTLFFCNSKH